MLLFVALEQGPQFASVTAAGALAGGLAWLSFAISYAWAATHMSWLLALLISLSAYLVIGMTLVLSAPPFALVVAMVVVAVVLAPLVFPRNDRTTHRPAARSWFWRDGSLRCAGSVRDGSSLSWAVGQAFGVCAIGIVVNAACICRDQTSKAALRAERARP
jgi:hypothetical protein